MAPRWHVASRVELMAQGFTSSRIKNWHQRGRLVQVMRGVYSFGRDVETRQAAFRAALSRVGDGSALTGSSACEVWGLTRHRAVIPRYIEVATGSGKATTHRGCSPALRGTRVKAVSRQFEPGDLRQKDGLALTRPALALIDFTVNASDREVHFAFLEACRLGLFDERDLRYCFQRVTGRRGAKKLRPYLALWVPELKRIRSVLEGWFLLTWIERDLPMPKVNEKVFGYEVDCHWPKQRVALELDGDAFHSDPVRKQLDLQKQRHLEAKGLVVIRVTYKEFEADPTAVVNRLAAVLGLSSV